jgi:hypothetical protein
MVRLQWGQIIGTDLFLYGALTDRAGAPPSLSAELAV